MNKKKLLALLMALVMTFSLVPVTALAEVPTGDFYVDSSDENLYHIASLEGLKAFRDSVNGGNTYAGKTVQLDANINLGEDLDTNDQQISWVPIGNNNAGNPSKNSSSIRFEGIFDGNDCTISNLMINDSNLICAGLFGIAQSGEIRNLTLNNVDITAKSWIGSVVGFSYSDISNCHVTGTIDIDGHYMQGGIVGQAYNNITNCSVNGGSKTASHLVATYMENDLEADKIGGIIGHWNDGKVGTMSNCSVANITIAGSRDVGGMVGYFSSYNTLQSCSVSDLTITINAPLNYANSKSSKIHGGGVLGSIAEDDARGSIEVSVQNIALTVEYAGVEAIAKMGFVSGGKYSVSPMAGVSNVANAGITVSGTNSSEAEQNCDNIFVRAPGVTASTAVAEIGNEQYPTLAEAIDAVPANTETTITMIEDSAEPEVITIAAGKNITLDLAGHTVSHTSALKSVYFITNGGNLTVKDSGSNGKITMTAVADTGYSVENVTVFNENGTLSLQSGTIENTTNGGLSYAVKNSSNAWANSVVSTFNMTGGRLAGDKTDNTLRVYQNTGIGWKVNCKNYVNISGGTIDNGIFFDTFLYTTNQDATGFNATDITRGCVIDSKVNITGGTVNGLVDLKIRHPYSTELNITGGDFTNAKLRVRKYASEYGAGLKAGTIPEPTEPMVNISGGRFDFVDAETAFQNNGWESYTEAYSITGGKFSVDPSAHVAEGYQAVNNTDADSETYGYVIGDAKTYVAQIGTTKYETLEAAIAAAQSGETVKLLKDVDTTGAMYSVDTRFNLWINKSITLDGDGHTLTVKGRGIGVQGASDNIDVTIKNITVKNVGNVNGRCVDTRGKLNSLTLENATLTTAESSYTGYLQPLTIGGNQSTPTTTVTIKDSNLVTVETANKGYAITTFNPVNMTVTGSTIKGWACFNLKGADSSAGSKNSVITVSDSTLVSANGTPGDTNAYSLIKIEDDNIKVSITDTEMDVNGVDNTQSIVSFQKPNLSSSANCEVSLGGGNKVTLEGYYWFASNMGDSSKLSISGGLFNEPVPETCCAAGYIPAASSDSTHQHTVKQGTYVAQIGDVKYETLQAAFNAVQNGETIILLDDLTQDDGVKFDHAGVSATLDLNTKTFTVNEGANLNNRAIRIDNGTLEVCNGTIVAVGSGTTSSNGAGCYGAFRVEANGVLNAHDLTLTNARPWGLNVKVLGGEATLTNVSIESHYGGGIEVTEADLGEHSKPGTATLTDCTFTQTGYFDHCSTAVSVSGNSYLIVNSGEYTGENFAAYVFSSGGYITVNGGTFTSTNEGNDTAAFKAMIDTNTYKGYEGGLIFNGGKFSGNFSIQDPATAVITGGHFTADPEPYLAEGYEKVESTESGYTWTVQAKAVAQIGNVKYTDLQAAFNDAQSGDTVQLLTDIVSSSWFDVNGNEAEPEQKSISLDLNGHNISSRGLWQAGGSLNVTGEGTITSTNPGAAPISIYYDEEASAKRTLTIGRDVTLVGDQYGLNIFGTNDGSNNTIDVNINGTVKGTVFVLGNLTNDSNAIMVNVNGTVDTTGLAADSDGYLPNGIALNGYANVTVNSGAVVKGGTAVEVRAGNLTINGGTFTALEDAYNKNANGSGVASHGAAVAVMQHTTAKKIVVRINGGTFEGPCALGIANPQANTDENVTVTVTGGIFKGELNQTVKNEDNRVTGFISGGTYYDESVKTEDYIASGYEAVRITASNRANAGFEGNNAYDNWYQVGKISSGTITRNDEQPDDTQVTFTAPRTVVNEDNNDAALHTGSNVTVNVKAPVEATADGVENIATNNALDLYTDNQLSAVVSAAMPEVAENAGTIDVEIVIVKDGGRQEENNNKVTKVTYDVHPEAIVYQGNEKIGSVNLEEVELNSEKSYTIKLPTTGFSKGDTVRVTHIHANGESEVIGTYEVGDTDYIEISGITSFSDFELAYVDTSADDVSVSTGMTLSLNESIDVNMYMYGLTGTFSNYKVSSWVNTRQVLDNVALSESNLHSSQIKNTDAYKLVVANCAAKEVGDTITVRIEYNGTLVKEFTYSVKQYCENACKSASNSAKNIALQDLCRAVLDYGTAAQYNFSYNVSNPANENYSSWATAMSYSIPADKNVKASSVSDPNPFSATGMTLSLESKVEINFYFKPIGDISQYTFTVQRGNGDEVNVPSEDLTQKNGYYVLKVDGIAAVDLDETVTVTGSYGGGLKTINYSPLSYAYVNQNVSGYETLGDVLRAMYYYNQMAETYFSINN